MSDLGERYATKLDRLLDDVARLLAHEELNRTAPHRRPSNKGIDVWLRRAEARHRDAHTSAIRRLVDVQPGLLEARPDLAARTVADRLRDDSPAPPPDPDPPLDLSARLAHVRAIKNKLQEGPAQ